MASSKSLASTGSMVKVSISRQSFLFLNSSLEIVSDKFSAAFKTASSNTSGKPLSINSSFIAISFISDACNILTTSPSGFLSALSHFTIFTTTLLPSTAPFNFSVGIKKSGIDFSVAGTKNAFVLPFCILPIKVVCFLSTTLVIFPSDLRLLPPSLFICTLTVSP